MKMTCGSYRPASIIFVLTMFAFGFLIATFPLTVFLFEMVYAQKSSIDNGSLRTVIRSPQYHGSLFANLISVGTDKQLYRPHENINIIITNTGTQPVNFSSSDSDIKIINLDTNESYIPTTVLLSSVIPSGSSKAIVWNQEDFIGQQVKPGNYSAVVTVGSLQGNTSLVIK